MRIARITIGFTLLFGFTAEAIGSRPESCPIAAQKFVVIVDERHVRGLEDPAIEVSTDGDLSVRLVADGDADIDLRSVRIRYRSFNITSRIAGWIGGISPDMRLPAKILPAGEYRVSIRVRDSIGRASTTNLTLQVSQSNESLCQDLNQPSHS